jgi:glycosyltransferase involved in cell wall biosynthesis
MSSAGLSVIMITHNAMATLEAALCSVAFADELIVVDSGSDDGTVALAKRFTDRVVVTEDWPGFGKQKNRALALASRDWVLCLDADEVLSAPLQAEIQAIVSDKQAPCVAYEIARRLRFHGKVLRYGVCYRERVLRLFRRAHGRFTDDLVHEKIVVDGSVACLKHWMWHDSYRDVMHLLDKVLGYARLGASVRLKRGCRGGIGIAVVHGVGAFVKFFFLRLGFLDGALGFLFAWTASVEAFYRYVYLAECQGILSAIASKQTPTEGSSS